MVKKTSIKFSFKKHKKGISITGWSSTMFFFFCRYSICLHKIKRYSTIHFNSVYSNSWKYLSQRSFNFLFNYNLAFLKMFRNLIQACYVSTNEKGYPFFLFSPFSETRFFNKLVDQPDISKSQLPWTSI